LIPKSRGTVRSFVTRIKLGFVSSTKDEQSTSSSHISLKGEEELETTNLFDETEIVASGGFDALAGVSIEPQVLIQETKVRLLA
jgi:hypothetical protein